MHQLIRRGAIAASALALGAGFAACEPNVNQDNLRHEAVSYTHLTLPTNREV